MYGSPSAVRWSSVHTNNSRFTTTLAKPTDFNSIRLKQQYINHSNKKDMVVTTNGGMELKEIINTSPEIRAKVHWEPGVSGV